MLTISQHCTAPNLRNLLASSMKQFSMYYLKLIAKGFSKRIYMLRDLRLIKGLGLDNFLLIM